MASKEKIRQHLAQSSNIDLEIAPKPKAEQVRKMTVMEHLEKSGDL